MYNNIIASIDIGSSKIKTIIGKFEEDSEKNMKILGVGVVSSNAMRKGVILDMNEFKNDIEKSLVDAENMAGEHMSGVSISFNSSSLEIIDNKGMITVGAHEVSDDDIERVLNRASDSLELPNREILKTIPDTFVVDNEEGVKEPIGMAASKLEAKVNIFSINTNILNNFKKAIHDIGADIYDVYPNVISSSEGVLTRRQKELGVACIDVGATTTGITVYEEGSLKFAKVLPIGGESVTNDVAIGGRTSIDVAEKLKIEYSAINLAKNDKFKDKEISFKKVDKDEDGTISELFLSQIVTARYEEIFYKINDELKSIGKDGMLPEGIVFVGGGAKITGLAESAKEILRLPVNIGIPVDSDADASVSDPVFAGVIGTLILTNKHSLIHKGIDFSFSSIFGFIGSIFSSIGKAFKKLLP